MTAELRPGTVLGSYELLVEIGRGGMASVWVARAREGARGGELVAVKAILPELGRDLEFRSMFLDEGRLAKSIDHPNVVAVHDVSEDDGLLFMAMEWIVGDSLRAVISAAGARPIPYEIGARVVADAAAGLHAAHELRGWDGELRELVHCDVSPHNVLIGLDGAVKLVDFGVASAAGVATELQENSVRGKYGYMSPEQARGDRLDRRSDVFSLGIVLYELTTGRRLFKGRDKGHTLDLVQWGVVPPPSEIESRYPRDLEKIVLKALRRDVQERYGSAAEVQHALERYLVNERVAVPRAGIAGLLKRVLRQRLDQLRDAVRAELERRDGAGAAAHVAGPTPLIGAEDVDSISVSEIGSDSSSHPPASALSSPGIATFASPPSEPTQSSVDFQASSMRNSSQPASRRPAPRRSRIPIVVAYVVGLLTGVVLVLVTPRFLQSGNETDLSAFARVGGEGDRTERAERRTRHDVAEGSDAASIDDLEVIGADGGGRARREATGSPASRSREDRDPKRPKAIDVELSEEPSNKKSSGASKETESKEDPVPAGERPPLSRGAAIASLGGASRAASSCKRPGGPTGSGRVTVTFSPSGRVSGVNVAGKFAGSSVGSCVASRFRSAKIPAFSGSAVTLGHGFRIPD